MPIETLNPDAWKLVGHLEGSSTQSGGTNFGWGTVSTKDQTLTTSAILSVYRLQQGDQSLTRDYFLVTGDVYHGIQGSPTDPSSNWVSVGFYANYMKLRIENTTPNSRLQTFGPNSTAETATVSFSIGGELGAEGGSEGGKGSGSVNASVGVSFSAAEVSFAARPSSTSIEWYTSLPGVGWLGPATPPNPAEPSYAGYIWNPAVIFEVPQGKMPVLRGSLEVEFEYNWTRGLRARTLKPYLNLSYRVVGAVTPEIEEKKELPTILEVLRSLTVSASEDGKTDTFLAALSQTGTLSAFGDSNLEQFVVCPTNAAIETYFAANPSVALAAVSPANQRWLSDWVADRIVSLPPKSAWQGTLSKLKTALASSGEWYDCADGILLVTDSYETDARVKPALDDMIAAAVAG